MQRKPIVVTDIARDRKDVEKALKEYSIPIHRRPRLQFSGPSNAQIVDEWEVVPHEIWTLWRLTFEFN